MKLHLGCGHYYLKGYVNIDLPFPERPLQKQIKVDVAKDILQLKYPQNSIEEIRLHHVFEHFTRPIACGLVVRWRTWLKTAGVLHIEVPDFDKSARIVLNPFTPKKAKLVSLRHIFGSQEADWANHYEGWSLMRLTNFLKIYGFDIQKTKKSHWRGTHNITVIAQKSPLLLFKKSAEKITKNYLKNYLVDFSPSERELLKLWLKNYNKQIND